MTKEDITVSTDFVTAAELRDRDESIEISIEIVRSLSSIETSSKEAQDDREVVRCPECEREITARTGVERIPHTPECSIALSEVRA
ncbi:hypothetical protein [Halalkalicoccus subterraneus]|uniref:hypothetical protein n=1 Tax=Halalkalicoccus subterraneus TaxID=2675002 RepID=UPI000EFBA0A6|nr:hypothetical protein [Halalkalicoccus subterraneus]